MSATRLLRPQRPRPHRLADLAALLGVPAPAGERVLTGVSLDSRAVRPGDLYAALPGARAHGGRFLAEALAHGAAAVLTDPAGAAETTGAPAPVLVVPDPRAVLGRVSSWVYGDPSSALLVLGVTGTNGKTTTSYLLDGGLRQAGQVTGLVGTVETRVAGQTVPSVRTTPEAPELQALFATMRERAVTAVAMEVSSHALALGRVDGTRFAVGGFTNLSQDHLDFHGDMAAYFAAKALLFDGRCEHEVVTVDDEWGRRLVRAGRTVTLSAGADPSADWRAVDLAPPAPLDSRPASWPGGSATTAASGQRFRVLGPGGIDLPASIRLPGTFNVGNALLAIAMLSTVGVDVADAVKGVADTVVPGRMEPVDAGQPFAALVDYAHTPDAVSRLLAALRPGTGGRLIVVLGCGGDRDRDKRPLMGVAAARGSDLLVVTDDNPRSEDPGRIRAAMLAGALAVPSSQRGQVVEIGDRRAAVAAAVRAAAAGDTVVVAGKGHEQGQDVGGVLQPFDDRTVLRAAIGGAEA